MSRSSSQLVVTEEEAVTTYSVNKSEITLGTGYLSSLPKFSEAFIAHDSLAP